MSLQAMAWAIEYQDLPRDQRTNRILSSAKLVLLALANHASPDGEDCFPAIETIMSYTGLSERASQYALRALEDHGTIVKTADPMVRQSTIGRSDRRPQSYDIVALRGVQDRNQRGAKSKIESPETGCKVSGDLAPEPVLEPVPLKDEPTSTSSRRREAPPGHQDTLDLPAPKRERHWTDTDTARRVPEDFTIGLKMREWARENTPAVDLGFETAQFLDYWRAAAGPTARKKDWLAAWRTWMRKAQRYAAERAARNGSRGRTRVDSTTGRMWQE